jgi:hypothetical protein
MACLLLLSPPILCAFQTEAAMWGSGRNPKCCRPNPSVWCSAAAAVTTRNALAAASAALAGHAAVTANASSGCDSGWCWLLLASAWLQLQLQEAYPDGSQLCTKRDSSLVRQHIALLVLELVGEATHCYA